MIDEALFPHLTSYELKSKPTAKYNCIAYGNVVAFMRRARGNAAGGTTSPTV